MSVGLSLFIGVSANYCAHEKLTVPAKWVSPTDLTFDFLFSPSDKAQQFEIPAFRNNFNNIKISRNFAEKSN
jgi:hypothetical protein